MGDICEVQLLRARDSENRPLFLVNAVMDDRSEFIIHDSFSYASAVVEALELGVPVAF